MAAKKDFMTWQKDAAENYGIEAEALEAYKDTVILTFTDNGLGVAVSRHRAKTAYADPSSKVKVAFGETWVCKMTAVGNMYAAAPVCKVDANFLFGAFSEEQKEEIARIIWINERASLEPAFEEKYRVMIEAEAAAKAKAEVEADIEALKKTIGELTMENAGLKKAGARKASLFEIETSVRREGPDTISSDFFTEGRYTVHLNGNHTIMEIAKSDSGNLDCIGNRLELRGLGAVSPFNGPCDMETEYIPQRRALQVRLA